MSYTPSQGNTLSLSVTTWLKVHSFSCISRWIILPKLSKPEAHPDNQQPMQIAPPFNSVICVMTNYPLVPIIFALIAGIYLSTGHLWIQLTTNKTFFIIIILAYYMQQRWAGRIVAGTQRSNNRTLKQQAECRVPGRAIQPMVLQNWLLDFQPSISRFQIRHKAL
jgi:hypothetical protein